MTKLTKQACSTNQSDSVGLFHCVETHVTLKLKVKKLKFHVFSIVTLTETTLTVTRARFT